MRTMKTPRGTHNRRYHGSWNIYGTKEERKANRKIFKAVRHKLLMGIPLSEEEQAYKEKECIEVDTPMRCDGTRRICY